MSNEDSTNQPAPENALNLGDAIEICVAGDLVLIFLRDTGKTEEADRLESGLRKFKANIRESLDAIGDSMAAGLGQLLEDAHNREGRDNASFN